MAGLVPAIHVFASRERKQDVDHRDKPGDDDREVVRRTAKNKMTSSPSLFLGIISGERRRSHAEVAERAGRIAGGLQQLGVRHGDCVCILMRNDIAFIEAAYAVALLGAYAVPVN